ncbi:MAG: M28 family peptidase [Coriobacteriia bacterium]
MSEAVQYVRELADRIGPRPATTDTEAQAAAYLEDVFAARGLEVERQDFECPRTYSWAYVIYHALTVAVAASVFFPVMRWPAVAISALVAVSMWMDLDTRGGLARLMPKGPSQNIIARQVPKSRRNEKPRRIVIVAHYDSARASLAFSPSMVKNFNVTFGLMKACTFAVPFMLLANALPLTQPAQPYLWYATLVVAGYLLIPLIINAHRELFMPHVDGAGDNASGVAAMLAVMEAIVPVPEGGAQMATQPLTSATLWDTADEGVPAPARLPDDFEWAESPASAAPSQPQLRLDTVEFDVVTSTKAPVGSWGEVDTDFDGDGVPDDEEPPRFREVSPQPVSDADRERRSGASARQEEPRAKKGLLGRLGRKGGRSDEPGAAGWLGLGGDFDAREAGRKIGSWDQFEEDDDFGDKGGAASGDFMGDPDYAAEEAARIRRRVTEHVDRDIADKEIWFVATGAEEVGTYGMQEFLKTYADDLRSAFIINIDGVASGKLHWITEEGMARGYRATPRLLSTAKRVSRENQIAISPKKYRALSTDATPALARGFKAMSVMAFDINGRIPNWHWKTDTSDTVEEETLDRAVEFVTAMVREL